MGQAQEGDVVRIHYTGRFADGDVFDSSEGGEPLEFRAGSEELISGVSKAVVGMEEGEKKTVRFPASEGYGERNAELVIQVPMDALPEDTKVGDQLGATINDQTVPVMVMEISEEFAQIDANPPLAGHELEFDLELVAIVPA